ncbi:MAG TPA: PDZ domain-containing protein, partial [Bacteroidota bacterium]
ENETVIPARDGDSDESSLRNKVEPATITLEKIGVTVRNIDSDIKKQYEVESGVYVEDVEPLSEAAQRALLPHDVILSAGDSPVTSAKQFQEIIKSKKPGDALLLRVKRASKQTQFVAIEIPK